MKKQEINYISNTPYSPTNNSDKMKNLNENKT